MRSINADENLPIKIKNIRKAFTQSVLSTPGMFLHYKDAANGAKMSRRIQKMNALLDRETLKDKQINKISGDDAIALSYIFISIMQNTKPTILPNSVCEGGLQDVELKDWGNGKYFILFLF